eukprot:3654459-Heterocapsa_arctica.AAC.1
MEGLILYYYLTCLAEDALLTVGANMLREILVMGEPLQTLETEGANSKKRLDVTDRVVMVIIEQQPVLAMVSTLLALVH